MSTDVSEDEAVASARPRRDLFSDLYRRHHRVVLTTVLRRVDDLGAAEDLTEQVFLVAWQRFREGEDVDLRWLHATVRNVVGNEYQRRQSATSLLERLASLYAHPRPSPDDEGRKAEVRRRLRQLQERDREVIYLAHWLGLTGEEIAVVLEIAPASVRKRLQRAREAARVMLGDLMTSKEGSDGRS